VNNPIRAMTASLKWVDRRLPVRLRGVVHRVADSEVLLSASSLAFYGLVSAMPLLLITFAVVEMVGGEDTLQRFADEVSQTGLEGSGEFVDQIVAGGGSLTIATLVFTIWPATAYGGGLRSALSRHADHAEEASGLRGRVLGLGMILVLPLIVLTGIPLMFFLTTLPGDGVVATVLGWAAALGTGAVVVTAVTAALYHSFAPRALGFREAVSGAALTAVFTALFSLAFVFYLQVGDTEDRFGGGTIALVVLLGIWLFVANILLLAGFHTVLELQDGAGEDGGEAPGEH
jgi:membrane protein